ncbi:LTA synthase family protein [Zhengella sp. ZM62]|uniref:LTA synthase family protein n=1 Tax=Zhengella sedimenti TaxID=3390035 RepID=UPI00397587D6
MEPARDPGVVAQVHRPAGPGGPWPDLASTGLLLVMSSLPLSFRLLYMLEAGARFRLEDLAGAGRDIAVGIIAAVVLVALYRIHKAFFLLAAIAWLALNVGYYEFLYEFASPYFLIHAAQLLDSDFFLGSGASLRHPVLVVAWLGVIVAGAHLVARRSSARLPFRLGVAGALLLAGMQFFPGISQIAPWRQRDFVSCNLADLATRAFATPVTDGEPAELPADAAMVFAPDLSGVSRLTAADRNKRNVLLIMLEGANGGHLPVNAARYGLDNQIVMPRLDAIARAGISWSAFLTHQRQSNRGGYALLCGDLPRLANGTPKMSEIANGAERPCLPEVLRSHGYATLFMKGGDLDFQMMDAFARKAGFDRAFGSADFDDSVPRGKWGIPDGELYKRALDELTALEQTGRPWFVTLFTVSTHHPFDLPESFAGSPNAAARARAWDYADQTLASLMDELAARDLLADTLVLITSDEASVAPEKRRTRIEELEHLVENWGLLVALMPEALAMRIDEPFQQSDIALSVLDYLGIENPGGVFAGRSLFRTYRSPRPMYFANLYKNRIFELDTGGILTVCDESFLSCSQYGTEAGLFSAGHRVLGRAQPPERLRAVKRHTLKPLPLRL